MHIRPLLLTLAMAFAPGTTPAQAQSTSASADDRLAREIFAELVNINTTHAMGSTRAAEAMAKRLLDAGFPAADVRVLGPAPKNHNLVARYRGTGAKRPLLLLAHLDVVEAKREDWSLDPFTFVEKDGYFYGRGTSDDKAMAAVWIATLIRFKKEGFKPDRDLIVALTDHEEGMGDANGVRWLLKNHHDLIDAEYCLNEGGGGRIKDGKYVLNEVQAAEKHYVNFRLEATNKGGHSSLPIPDNAIYQLAAALTKLAAFAFPVRLTEVTRAYFERTAVIVGGQEGGDMKTILASSKLDPNAVERVTASPLHNATLRTTCVATMIEGGHAENALPQMARATVNCRLIPGEDPEGVRRTLERVIEDAAVTVTATTKDPGSPVSPLRPDVLQAIEGVTTQLWPGVPVVPIMSTGGTDGASLRTAGIPAYGVSGLFEDIDDIRWHGRDERVGVKQFDECREFLYRLVRELGS
jgi:acetylornithine deacetylase/succinyl-diaminopimelate desuccinylase-like protein